MHKEQKKKRRSHKKQKNMLAALMGPNVPIKSTFSEMDPNDGQVTPTSQKESKDFHEKNEEG